MALFLRLVRGALIPFCGGFGFPSFRRRSPPPARPAPWPCRHASPELLEPLGEALAKAVTPAVDLDAPAARPSRVGAAAPLPPPAMLRLLLPLPAVAPRLGGACSSTSSSSSSSSSSSTRVIDLAASMRHRHLPSSPRRPPPRPLLSRPRAPALIWLTVSAGWVDAFFLHGGELELVLAPSGLAYLRPLRHLVGIGREVECGGTIEMRPSMPAGKKEKQRRGGGGKSRDAVSRKRRADMEGGRASRDARCGALRRSGRRGLLDVVVALVAGCSQARTPRTQNAATRARREGSRRRAHRHRACARRAAARRAPKPEPGIADGSARRARGDGSEGLRHCPLRRLLGGLSLSSAMMLVSKAAAAKHLFQAVR